MKAATKEAPRPGISLLGVSEARCGPDDILLHVRAGNWVYETRRRFSLWLRRPHKARSGPGRRNKFHDNRPYGGYAEHAAPDGGSAKEAPAEIWGQREIHIETFNSL